tara:strand:- start:841 stop:1134 length:294 start_codon:yes stop_codon:yes gene_type:complete
LKITIVLDTEDREGLTNARKIADLLYKKYVDDQGIDLRKATFGKIALIKFIREHSYDCERIIADSQLDLPADQFKLSGLRAVKNFVDQHWDDLDKTS